jgi:hypothetical protein
MIDDAFNPVREGADALEEGYYLIQRWRAGRVPIPVRIWFGPPVDPEDPAAVLDRSWRWQIQIAGTLLEEGPVFIAGLRIEAVSDFWPACRKDEIDAAEYQYRIERAAWAAEHDPNDAYARPGGRIDPLTATLP